MSDREEFEKWFEESRYVMAKVSTREAMFDAWQAARAQDDPPIASIAKALGGFMSQTPDDHWIVASAWKKGGGLSDVAVRYMETEPDEHTQQGEGREDVKERLREAISEALGEALDCTRVWEAWGYGTMSQNDFQPVNDDPDRLEELVDAALSVLLPPSDKPEGEWVKCSEQMPKIGQRVILKSKGVVQHYMPILDAGDIDGFGGGGEMFWDFGEAMDDDYPLVDFERDEWMPVPDMGGEK